MFGSVTIILKGGQILNIMALQRSHPFLVERTLSRKSEGEKNWRKHSTFSDLNQYRNVIYQKYMSRVFFCKSLSLLWGFSFKLSEMQQLKAILHSIKSGLLTLAAKFQVSHL